MNDQADGLRKAIQRDQLHVERPPYALNDMYRLAIAIMIAVACLFAIAVALTTCPPRAKAADLIEVDTSSVDSYRGFFHEIGATPLRHENSERHRALCEKEPGWLWVGSYRGPTGVVLSFCANPLPADIRDGEMVCNGFAGLRFVAIKAPATIICERTAQRTGARLVTERGEEDIRPGQNHVLHWTISLAETSRVDAEAIIAAWTVRCEQLGGRIMSYTHNFQAQTLTAHCLIHGGMT